MSQPTTLAERMKRHEHIYRTTLPKRVWTLFRLDGRSFHTYTRGLARPYDAYFAADMDATALALCDEITGTAFAYVQSDEISILVTDFANPSTEAWMGGVTAKMLSLSAAHASTTFNARRRTDPVTSGRTALFDSRVWTLADPAEVANYFVWRQRDAVKNSISMAASAHFSHARLNGLNSDQRQELLFTEAGVNWNDYPDGFKRGRLISRHAKTEMVTIPPHRGSTLTEATPIEVIRHKWVAEAAPHFSATAENWLATGIPPMPGLA